MDNDTKNSENQDIDTLVHSLELVSARMFESVITLSQTASSNTPEMHDLFNRWVSCVGGEIISAAEEQGGFEPNELAQKIGVLDSTIISLALALHRQGKLKIKYITAERCEGDNQDICGCLK